MRGKNGKVELGGLIASMRPRGQTPRMRVSAPPRTVSDVLLQ